MWAVLSDIHANLEALDAVLDDIARHPVTRIICLGDVLGYGPNPIECLERAMEWNVTLMGDHDQAVMAQPVGFSLPTLERWTIWQRERLESSGRNDLWEYLGLRPRSRRDGDFLFVHGSPRNPLNEYLFPEDVYNEKKMDANFRLTEQYCFAGHTHVPGVFTEGRFLAPDEFGGVYRLDHRKTIVNVGSVGQPRDGDWRACYALVDGLTVTFRRVEYDVDATVQKIYANPELDNFLGDRLREGR
ncbi:Metallophosphoesterase OS=Planctomyces brasiliensis (strain ATCC 49424 / DSM 5305 / JCM 21570 / NBRC 103401 / IFAM 1448) GN=Plabr_0624 PE=4 SV=1: Metallophos_2 [Gemmataceae bacterium]|nr:Metallophosphoesterase OS=Planctomyces brasiliensis (strain ATCC 49424 / DSM 5305 / JCM 21570 / NBRC 103401 / IFAM 1448) GN=Plabr_0624 PE=4 SV=1: Metallophos_2 [Gemmataceae bacterium]VTU00358.1 Metallophosphoesterase OS=Planctomyces brasiliensis (strain ATCC 49424 / DSM 5305 / JCM 21570 / NBRC 103401 / IFAM 1448) GN=Plabr_0624 PE=4 SV=1: Metallophos_2 [Gemmataceae bacterium]